MVDFVKDSIEEPKKNNAVRIVPIKHFGMAKDLGPAVHNSLDRIDIVNLK